MIAALPLLSLLAMVAALGVGFAPLVAELRPQWNDPYGSMSHAYLVFALAAWFAIRAWRAHGGPPSTRVWWPALVPLLALLAVGELAEALFVGTSRSIVLPPLLASAVALAWGPAAALRLAWPIAFLYFGLPIWTPLNPLLQKITVAVSQTLVHLSGVPAYVEGNFVHLVSGVFQIASGCAGLNFFVVALTLAAIASTLFLTRWQSRLQLAAAAVIGGLVANWLRVTSLIIIGHVTQMQHYLVRVDHLTYGWVLFLVVMVPVVLLLRRLQAAEERAEVVANEITARVPMLRTGGALAASVAFVAVACALLALPSVLHGSGPAVADTAPRLPFAGVRPVPRFASGWAPVFVGAQEARAESADGRFELYAASYARQTRGAQMFEPANLAGGHEWRLSSSGRLDLPGGESYTEEEGSFGSRRYLLWTWYEAGGRRAVDKGGFRRGALGSLLHGRRDARVFAVLGSCEGDCTAARTAFESWSRSATRAVDPP